MTAPGPAGAAPRWGRLTLAALGGWAAVGAVSAGLQAWSAPPGLPMGLVAKVVFASHYLFYAPATLLAVAMARRFPVQRPTIARDLAAQAVVALLVALASVVYSAWLFGTFYPSSYPGVGGRPSFEWLLRTYLVGRGQIQVFVYAGMVAAARAWTSAREARAEQLRSARLTAQLAQAQLTALRSQLDPHFLFNTLQAVSSLVSAHPDSARRMLVLLGDLLRTSLDETRGEVTLAEELAFLERYLEIEQVRFPDRLRVVFDVAPETRDAMVPGLLLQPVVENAVRYAVAPRAAGGTVTVSAERANGHLCIAVRDDGPGLAAGAREGLGLTATRERLRTRFGPAQSLRIGAPPGGTGCLVEIEMPFQTLPG